MTTFLTGLSYLTSNSHVRRSLWKVSMISESTVRGRENWKMGKVRFRTMYNQLYTAKKKLMSKMFKFKKSLKRMKRTRRRRKRRKSLMRRNTTLRTCHNQRTMTHS